MSAIAQRVAACSWSLRPTGPADLVAKLARAGINKVQLALGPLASEPAWADAAGELAGAGVAVVSGMFGCVGEDYSTLESIRRTGGVVPDATWPANRRNILRAVPIAASLGLHLVSFHAGFLPAEQADPAYAKLLGRIGEVADAFAAEGIDLALETGQEDAPTLARFLDRLHRPNVGVNFDPANMILYAKGDPVAAAGALAGRIRQVHVKDALPADVPGQWGREVPAGSGAVDWPAFFAALRGQAFGGFLCIEREGGGDRLADVAAARELILRTWGSDPGGGG